MPTLQEKLQEKPNITYEELHESMWKYARWMSSHNGNSGHWLLNKEDLYSEYLLVIFKCYARYSSKESMTLEELKKICKSGMRNKFRSLLSHCFQTHRVVEKEIQELDGDSHIDVSGGIDPSVTRNDKDIFAEISSNLNSFDVEVLDAVIGNNERVGLFLELHRRRMSFCLVNKSIEITPHMIAIALCIDEDQVKNSFTRIEKVLQKRSGRQLFSVISNNEHIWI